MLEIVAEKRGGRELGSKKQEKKKKEREREREREKEAKLKTSSHV